MLCIARAAAGTHFGSLFLGFRLAAPRKRQILSSSAALMVGLFAASGAQAQCMGGAVPTPFGTFQLHQFFPFGNGGGVNGLVSVINTVNTAFLNNTTSFVSAPGGPQADQQGGGEWARAIGGTVETKATGVTTAPSFLGFPVTGAESCNTKMKQDFGGVQVGHDIAILNGGNTGANWHFGVTGGYVESKARDMSPDGTLTGNFQVPFAGVYTAFTRGNFFADGQARLDFFQGQLSDPVANAVFDQRMDARGFSLTGNVGYRFDLPSNWFIEPSAGGVLSRVSADSLDTSGTFLTTTGTSLPGTVQIRDIDSALGRASVRVGTSVKSEDGTMTAQPFVTASVFHEFAGDVTTSITARLDQFLPRVNGQPDTSLNSTETLKTSRVGTYAQFGLGSSFQLIDTGWLGYARIDYKTGDNIQGVSINTGLRYQFNPGETALESLKDSPAPIARSSYNWTGFYLGGSAGGVWGEEHWRFEPFGTSAEPDFGGYLLGGQAGYNYQVGRIVAGIEGDFGFSNSRGGKSCPNLFFFSCEAEMERLGSLTGRLGYTWGRALFYAKGGWAAGELAAQSHLNPGSTLGGLLAGPLSTTKWANGWTVGGGMEFALTDSWSAKAEYMHSDLGKERFIVDDSGREFVNAATTADAVRLGVNYHFNH